MILLSKKYHNDDKIKSYFDKTKIYDDDLIDIFWIPNALNNSMEAYTLIEDDDKPGKFKISSDVGFIDKDTQKKIDEKWKFTDWENQIYGGDKSNIENSLPYIDVYESVNHLILLSNLKNFRSDKTPIKSVTSLMQQMLIIKIKILSKIY